MVTEALQDRGLTREMLRESLAAAPVSHLDKAPNLRTMQDSFFGERMWKADGQDQRSILPLLHFYVMTALDEAIRAELRDALHCFVLLCRRVFYLEALRNSRDGRLLPLLTQAEEEHHRNFAEVWGASQMRPKHHYSRHQRQQFEAHGMVIDTCNNERRHQIFKKLCNDKVKDVRHLENSVLASSFADDKDRLRPENWSLRAAAVQHGRKAAVCSWRKYVVGNPLLLADLRTCGIIADVLASEAGVSLQLQIYQLKKVLDPGLMEWKRTAAQQLLDIVEDQRHILLPAYWKLSGDSLLTLW